MPIKALPYPSEQATVEQEKVQKQFTQVSKQIEEIKSNSDSVRIALEQKIDQLVAVEQEKIQNQLTAMSVKLEKIPYKQEPVFAFRATSMKDGISNKNIDRNPGKYNLTCYFDKKTFSHNYDRI